MARIKPQALLQQSKKKKGPSGFSFVTIAVYCLIVLVMAFFLFGSYRYWNRRSKFQTGDMIPSVEHSSLRGDSKKVDIPKYASVAHNFVFLDMAGRLDVVIKTSKGSIVVELYKEGSPEAVNEFVESCQKGLFKGMLFSRVIKNFVIQWGDINKPESTEDWTTRGKHYNQLDKSLKHEAFMLGTSKTKHDGGGFDFFITTAPIPDLNEKINVFGRVINGEDVVQEIEEADTDEHFLPKTPIRIAEVILKQKL